MLKTCFSGSEIANIDHLTVLHNIMAHGDCVAENYNQLLTQETRKSDPEKRRIRAISRAIKENAGISVNQFNGVLMDKRFLLYVVSEFERYVKGVEKAVMA